MPCSSVGMFGGMLSVSTCDFMRQVLTVVYDSRCLHVRREMNSQVGYEEEGVIAKCDWIEACLFLKKPLAMFR